MVEPIRITKQMADAINLYLNTGLFKPDPLSGKGVAFIPPEVVNGSFMIGEEGDGKIETISVRRPVPLSEEGPPAGEKRVVLDKYSLAKDGTLERRSKTVTLNGPDDRAGWSLPIVNIAFAGSDGGYKKVEWFPTANSPVGSTPVSPHRAEVVIAALFGPGELGPLEQPVPKGMTVEISMLRGAMGL